MRTEDLEKLFQLVTSSGFKRPKAGVDFSYLYGQTDDNRDIVVSVAPDIPPSVPVGICGRARISGYSGFEPWREAVIGKGVIDARVEAVGALDSGPLNTLTESTALVQHCIKRGVRKVAVVAPLWHITRCVMSVVGEAARLRAGIAVVPWIGRNHDWDEAVAHSQGVLFATRAELVFYETMRIIRYVEKQDIPDPASVLEVLGHLR